MNHSNNSSSAVSTSLRVAVLPIVLICALAYGIASASALTNFNVRVVDSLSRRPLPNVLADLHPLARTEQTDENGWIRFRAVPPGSYTLCILDLGNQRLATCAVEIREHETVSFILEVTRPTTLPGAVIVHGRPQNQHDVTIIAKEEIATTKAHTLTEVLRNQSGIIIRESRNGDALVSINGSEPRQVKVLLNGLPLVANADGSHNLAQIPVTSVQEIRVLRGASAQTAGPGAASGLIDIRTIVEGLFSQPEASAQSRFGKWSRTIHQSHVELGSRKDRYTFSFDWEQREQRDNFEYRYTAQPSSKSYKGTRVNNDALSRVAAGTAGYRNVNISFSEYSSQRGLPDRASAPNLSARTYDTRRIGMLHWADALSSSSSARAGLSYQHNFSRAVDSVTTPTSSRFDSKYDNEMWQGSGEFDIQLTRHTTFDLAVIGSREKVTHVDELRPGVSLGKATRESAGVGVTITQAARIPQFLYLSDASVAGTLRQDYIRSQSSRNDSSLSSLVNGAAPVLSLSLSRPGNFAPFVNLSFGENWSAPTLTSLFWRRDARSEGNPALRPEQAQSRQLTTGLNWHCRGINLELSAHWHEADYTDLVIWRPDFRGVWRPVNLASSRISGRSDQIAISVLNRKLQIGYANDLLNPRNRTSGIDYNNQLTFRPHYTTRVEAGLVLRWLDLKLSHEMVARRYALESNTRWYDPYEVTALRGGIALQKGIVELRVGGEIHNLFDTQYAHIAHYPMPGRAWDVSLQLSLDWSKQQSDNKTKK